MNNGKRAPRTQQTKQETELLGAEEVAGLVGVKETTVYKWCKEGKLPCLKVGKRWRIRREALENFLKGSERQVTLAGQLGSFLRVPDNVLAIAETVDILRRLDAAYFRVGEERGGLLIKFYGGEKDPPDELRASLEDNGLEVERLEREGRFLMRPEADPLEDGRGDALGRILEEVDGKGHTVWASFNWVKQVDLETALGQQKRLAEIVETRQLVVKTAALEGAIDEWTPSEFRRVQSAHAAVILASESGLSLSRATPMPPS
jgi:excisionase family DNA binding protein